MDVQYKLWWMWRFPAITLCIFSSFPFLSLSLLFLGISGCFLIIPILFFAFSSVFLSAFEALLPQVVRTFVSASVKVCVHILSKSEWLDKIFKWIANQQNHEQKCKNGFYVKGVIPYLDFESHSPSRSNISVNHVAECVDLRRINGEQDVCHDHFRGSYGLEGSEAALSLDMEQPEAAQAGTKHMVLESTENFVLGYNKFTDRARRIDTVFHRDHSYTDPCTNDETNLSCLTACSTTLASELEEKYCNVDYYNCEGSTDADQRNHGRFNSVKLQNFRVYEGFEDANVIINNGPSDQRVITSSEKFDKEEEISNELKSNLNAGGIFFSFSLDNSLCTSLSPKTSQSERSRQSQCDEAGIKFRDNVGGKVIPVSTTVQEILENWSIKGDGRSQKVSGYSNCHGMTGFGECNESPLRSYGRNLLPFTGIDLFKSREAYEDFEYSSSLSEVNTVLPR